MRLKYAMNALKSWGWLGATASVLLALAGAAACYEAHCRELESQASAQIHQVAGRLRILASTQAVAPAHTRADWLASLPAAEARQRRLADLLEVSIREGVNATRTEHKLSVDQAAGLESLRVTMPVLGTYAQIRQFIGAALAQDPALSLDSLRLHRPSPQVGQVEAELVWCLHGRLTQEGL